MTMVSECFDAKMQLIERKLLEHGCLKNDTSPVVKDWLVRVYGLDFVVEDGVLRRRPIANPSGVFWGPVGQTEPEGIETYKQWFDSWEHLEQVARRRLVIEYFVEQGISMLEAHAVFNHPHVQVDVVSSTSHRQETIIIYVGLLFKERGV